MSARIWNSTKIAREIRRHRRKGNDISYNAMCRRHQGLVSAANYYFGSYRRAVEAAGICYSDIRVKPRWTKERIVAVIKKAYRQHVDLRWSTVSVAGDEVSHAAKASIRPKLFGGWRKALVAAGIDPADVCAYRAWPPDAVLKELRRRASNGRGAHSGAIQDEIPGLYRAAVRHFGSFRNALRCAGLDPAAISQRRTWSADLVRRTLRKIRRGNGRLTTRFLREHDSGALRAATIWFGSLGEALSACDSDRATAVQGA